MKDCPFEAWQLIQAKEILKWIRSEHDLSLNATNIITGIEDVLFNIAHGKLGLKPISKCTIQELQEELDKRLGK
ncbi:MAG: hypothetical protein E7088_09260 [Bacteroidales bacterium]|nr:hypothetical protein [Bacteroidales bacterium]